MQTDFETLNVEFTVGDRKAFTISIQANPFSQEEIEVIYKKYQEALYESAKALEPKFQKIVEQMKGKGCQCGAEKSQTTHSTWCPKWHA